ncbi:MAG: helix-turn-helix domain-containing protein, partial [Bacteroidales bacterium]
YSTNAIIICSFFIDITPVERKHIFDEAGLRAFAKRLKQVRKVKDLSQEELALRCELSLSQIARIETARINPTLSTVFRLARALDIELSELFNFKLPDETGLRGKYFIKDSESRMVAED